MPKRTLLSFSTLISAYSRSGDVKTASGFVQQMRTTGVAPNQFIFSSLVAACSKEIDVSSGKQVHAQVVVSGFELDPYVKASLIGMYTKCSDLASAVSAFKYGVVIDAVVFNSMLNGFAVFGCFPEAVELFGEMRRFFGLRPTEYSFGSLLRAGGYLGREVGEALHGLITKIGLDTNRFVATSLVDMYGKFEDTESMEAVYHHVQSADLALYNAMLVGLSQNGLHMVAWEYFKILMLEGHNPNECSFSSILKSCGGMKSLPFGVIIHGIVEKSESRKDLVVNTALIDMYMKRGMKEEAVTIFDRMERRNTVCYNSMIFGYVQNRHEDDAMILFIEMKRRRLEPDLATFVALMGLSAGRQWVVYVHAVKCGYGYHPMTENSLLDGLFKNEDCEEAMEFLMKMNARNIISWTTAIVGLINLDFHLRSIELFKEMMNSEVNPNNFTLSSVLKACGSLSNLHQGKCVHGYCLKVGETGNEFVNGALLDMYSKCGALEDSHQTFDEFRRRDTVSWNIMISAYAQHGFGLEALKLYTNMVEYNVAPNNVTFLALLSACNHCGLVDDGARIFEMMVSKHELVPSAEHYACMVDILGRVGMLSRAKCFIESMPIEADASIWTVFLSACKLHGNIEMAQVAADRIIQMEGEESPTIVLIANMYSGAGKWIDAESTRKQMHVRRQIKDPGVSWMQGMGSGIFPTGGLSV